jgi:hypothetical protein
MIAVDAEQGQLARSLSAATARDVIALDSTMGIASRMQRPSVWVSHYCAKATISFTPMLLSLPSWTGKQ